MIATVVLGVTVCIVMAAFFAGLETGLLSANQFSLYAAREKGVVYARAADFLLLKPERLLSTTLIGTNVSVVTATVILAGILRETGTIWAPLLGSVVLAVVMLVASEIIPKSFFRQHADTVAVRLAPALVVFYVIFYPIATALNIIVKAILLVTGQLRSSKEGLSSRQSLRTLVRLGSREAGLSLADQRVIEDIFDFQDTLAREVMVQIHRTLACPLDMPVEEIIRRGFGANVRFIPIYEHRLDNVVGCLDMEAATVADALEVEKLIDPPVFYPETKRIPELLIELNGAHRNVAFLSNEYGRISGIITPEDIISEIVGVRPGHKASHRSGIERRDDRRFEVVAAADVEDFRNETGIVIPKGPYDTVGGFIVTMSGRIPRNGDRFMHGDAEFIVTDCDDVHIKRIEVRLTRGSDHHSE